MNKNILVTGAMGFIGSYYARLLSQKGYYPTIIDKMTYAADVNRIKGIEDEIYIGDRLYVGDICNRELVQDIINKHDINVIVNFAAETHVDNSIKDSREFVKSNFEGVQILLDLCRENDIEKYVQISTDEVYGSAERWSFDENEKLSPGNPYSACKAAADLLCLAYWNTYQLPIVVTRSSNNYGPYQHTEKYIPKMITNAIHGKPLLIYGDGENVRDWLYVKDGVKAIKLVMEKGKIGEIYNIGGGKELTNNYVATCIAERFGVEIEYIEDRKGHDKRYSVNCDKIKDELGWKPVKKFEEGLNDTIRYYVEEEKRK
jgi:dTDP-glucose 4,6-dehydratase